MGYSLQFGAVWASFGNLLSGLALGLGLAVAAVACGTLIGLVAAFASVSSSRIARVLVGGYVMLIRNLPLLVLVLLVYFALPQLGIRFDKYESFIGALALYAGAYLTEVFRAGLVAVPKGVVEASRAIGLTRVQTNVWVVAPIMMRNALPSMGNTFIGMFKDSSIAAAIAVPELTFQARKINVDTFRVVETWIVASGLYIATCFAIAALLRRLERLFPKF
ncbi:amino acid ABC transporter permease [Microvirga sp. 17 mud 1-3]|uniref:amino acid ABC transporter permease n=1 Tax=Microvirga sp. 17 mud 1-3 TaxID=2082949 RepID=UPI000D6CC61C|nr:amino acid ABC transporter permease [Microvirga sp. 17 mud 1-3]AWM87265.1 amino acid ABC transporter permease [Microvirga sp. 17 mud 1-3]